MDQVSSSQGDAPNSQVKREAVKIAPMAGKQGILATLLPYMGPAFIASVAYMDPGNFATNIAGGSKFGYGLLWVVVASNLMAILIQTLSAKLGIAAGRNLAEMCREYLPAPVVWFLWILMEIVAMATDLAEFVGAALGFSLLFGFPLWLGGLATALFTFLLLGLERYGTRPLEGAITAFVGVVAGCYLIETLLGHHQWGLMARSAVVPRFSGAESVLVAAGILGATVMPHAIFLHSALMQKRTAGADPSLLRRLFRYEQVDILVAMGVAGLVNAAMLVMAASTFHFSGKMDIGTIEQAHQTLYPLLGRAAGVVFAVSLLASGLSSTVVGTMAGQVIMQGFVQRQIPLWLRRSITMLPSLIVIAMGLDVTRTLVASQVVLSFGLPFAIVPLVYFTRRTDIMGVLVNRPLTTLVAAVVGVLVILLNVYLVYQTLTGGD